MSYLVVLLTTIYFNAAGSPEIHVSRQPSEAVCVKKRDDWLAMEAWQDDHAPYAFKAVFGASCRGTVVGQRTHV